jgi:hypothetical protein
MGEWIGRLTADVYWSLKLRWLMLCAMVPNLSKPTATPVSDPAPAPEPDQLLATLTKILKPAAAPAAQIAPPVITVAGTPEGSTFALDWQDVSVPVPLTEGQAITLCLHNVVAPCPGCSTVTNDSTPYDMIYHVVIDHPDAPEIVESIINRPLQ